MGVEHGFKALSQPVPGKIPNLVILAVHETHFGHLAANEVENVRIMLLDWKCSVNELRVEHGFKVLSQPVPEIIPNLAILAVHEAQFGHLDS